MPEIRRLSLDTVLQIRTTMSKLQIATRDAFGATEPLNLGRLESAVLRQETGSGDSYKYTTIPEVGATLFYGIAMAHAFENGNKRTALVSLLVFLDMNKTLLVDATEDDLYTLAREMAAHELALPAGVSKRSADAEVQAVANWLRMRTRAKVLGDTAMPFKDLKQLLEIQGCTFERPSRNFIKIRRGPYKVKTGYPRQNFDVQVGEIKQIRRSLRLDEVHGVDSAGFYALEAKVDKIVNQYRNLMRRLADL